MTVHWRILFAPRFWIPLYSCDTLWDKVLRKEMENHPVVPINESLCRIGRFPLWVGKIRGAVGQEFPFSEDRNYVPYTDCTCVPRASTRLRIWRAMEEHRRKLKEEERLAAKQGRRRLEKVLEE